MNLENTKDKLVFFIDRICWAFITWIWYKHILFRCLVLHSYKASNLILLGCLVACTVVGMFLQQRKIRKGFSVFADLSTGYGNYAGKSKTRK